MSSGADQPATIEQPPRDVGHVTDDGSIHEDTVAGNNTVTEGLTGDVIDWETIVISRPVKYDGLEVVNVTTVLLIKVRILA